MSVARKTKSKGNMPVHPGSLVQGEKYRLILRGYCRQVPAGELVTFIGDTPCPATVIVLDRQQRRLYCGRESLFEAGLSEQHR